MAPNIKTWTSCQKTEKFELSGALEIMIGLILQRAPKSSGTIYVMPLVDRKIGDERGGKITGKKPIII